MKINKIAIVSKFGSKESEKVAVELAKKLLKLKSQVFTVAPVSVDGVKKVRSIEDLKKIKLDLAITLGGDGTTLRTFRNIANETPLLAVFGHVLSGVKFSYKPPTRNDQHFFKTAIDDVS